MTDLSSFVGRDALSAEVARLLAGHRLVTLLGPGGVGKTRLARHVAGRATADVVLVGLVEVRPDLPLARLISHLAGRELLVLDNCEHVAGHVAAVLRELLVDLMRSVPALLRAAQGRRPAARRGAAVPA